MRRLHRYVKAELGIVPLQPEADTDGRADDRRQTRVKSKALLQAEMHFNEAHKREPIKKMRKSSS